MLQVHVKLLYFETFLDIAVVLHAHPHLGLVAYLALMTLPSLRADLVYLCPAWSSFRGSLNLRSILIKRHVHSWAIKHVRSMKIVRRRNNFGDFPRGDQSSVEPTRWKLNFSEDPQPCTILRRKCSRPAAAVKRWQRRCPRLSWLDNGPAEDLWYMNDLNDLRSASQIPGSPGFWDILRLFVEESRNIRCPQAPCGWWFDPIPKFVMQNVGSLQYPICKLSWFKINICQATNHPCGMLLVTCQPKRFSAAGTSSRSSKGPSGRPENRKDWTWCCTARWRSHFQQWPLALRPNTWWLNVARPTTSCFGVTRTGAQAANA